MFGADQESRYQRHLQKSLGRKPLDAIDREDIATIRDTIFESGSAYESNSAVSLFNRVMNFGVEEHHIKFNPGQRLRKRHAEEPRTRTIAPTDLAKLWHMASSPVSQVMTNIIRILILSGQRRGEVASAHQIEPQLAAARPGWLIPTWRGERSNQERGTKNGHAHFLPLPPLLLSQFQEALSAAGASEYAFPSRYGKLDRYRIMLSRWQCDGRASILVSRRYRRTTLDG